MKLYYFPIAPNPTKVRIYLAEKGIEMEQVLVNLIKGEQKSEEHRARNPLANLPVLELDDGTHLSESLAIIELLEELHPQPPMIGTESRPLITQFRCRPCAIQVRIPSLARISFQA